VTATIPDHRVRPGQAIKLADVDTAETAGFASKQEVADLVEADRARIRSLQERLYAESRRSLLIVFQAIDTGGKDGAIEHVFGGVNPQGCQVWSFKVPSAEELSHDFLWRYHERAPARGMITIFNRSHYEDVLVVRVKQLVPETVWRPRYALINDFERLLVQSDVSIVKFLLHISKAEQKRRLESRRDDPEKQWKFAVKDLDERARWDDYQAAFEEAINQTSTEQAPWYVVPADRKWYRNLVVARTVADTLEAMNPQFPPPEPEIEQVDVPD
jgi:PPK2 family polyphosphate:nucleotide phosphotransferase